MPITGRDIVVIGASAGGVEALREVTQRLPDDLGAAVFVVVHLPSGAQSRLPEILARSGPLPAMHAEDGLTIERGRIYVAPPDHHLLLDQGRMLLSRGPHHNRHRPAVDPLFASAAWAYGPRVVGVVLTGTLDDGTAGLARIKSGGGYAIVQDPRTAMYPGMPESALRYVKVDRRVPLEEIASAIRDGVLESPAVTARRRGDTLKAELRAVPSARIDMEQFGRPSVYACPECHGSLWESNEDGVLQFRCRVGHSFSSEGLLAEHDGDLEATLWAALRSLEENASLRRKLAERMRDHRQAELAERYDERAEESERHARMLRELLTSEIRSSARGGPS